MAVLVPPLSGLGEEQEGGRRLHGAHLAALGNPMSRAAYSVAMTEAVASVARSAPAAGRPARGSLLRAVASKPGPEPDNGADLPVGPA